MELLLILGALGLICWVVHEILIAPSIPEKGTGWSCDSYNPGKKAHLIYIKRKKKEAIERKDESLVALWQEKEEEEE